MSRCAKKFLDHIEEPIEGRGKINENRHDCVSF